MSQIIDATRDQIAEIQKRIREKLFMSAARQIVHQFKEDSEADMLPLFYKVNFKFDNSSKLGRAEVERAATFEHPNTIAVCDLQLDKAAGELPEVAMNGEVGIPLLNAFPPSITGSLHAWVPDSAVIEFLERAKVTRVKMIDMATLHRNSFAKGLHGGATGIAFLIVNHGRTLLGVRAARHSNETSQIIVDRDEFARMTDDEVIAKVDELISLSIFAGFAGEEV